MVRIIALLLLLCLQTLLAPPLFGQAERTLESLPEYPALLRANRLFPVNQRQGLEEGKKALNALVERLGPEAPQLYKPYIMVSSMCRDMGELDASLLNARKGLAVAEKFLPTNAVEIALASQNIGGALLLKNDAAAALPFLQRAAKIYQSNRSFASLAYIKVSLGGAYHLLGEYALAEATLIEGREETLRNKFTMKPGQAESFISRANSTLGGLYASMGDYERAYALQKRNLMEKRRMVRSPRVDAGTLVSPLTSFARTCRKTKRYDEGMECLAEAEEALRKQPGGASPIQMASVAMERANIHTDQKRYEEALKNLAVADRLFAGPGQNKEHDVRDAIDNNRGYIYLLMGKPKEAEPLFRQVLARARKNNDQEAFGEATTHGNMAQIRAMQKQAEPTWKHLDASTQLLEQQMQHLRRLGSDQQRVAFFNQAAGKVDLALGLLFEHLPEDPGVRRATFETVLSRKGRAADLGRAIRSDTAAVRPLLQQRDALVEQISSRALRLALGEQAGATDDLAGSQYELENINRRLQQMEKAAPAPRYSLAALSRRLPASTVYIDYVWYKKHRDADGIIDEDKRPAVCAAFIVHSDGSLAAVPLGTLAGIEPEARALRTALARPGGDDWKEPARALHKQLVDPLLQHLKDKTELMISPDGILNLLPFAAFLDQQDQPLLERLNITYLGSGRELFEAAPTAGKLSIAVLAEPVYDGPGKEEAMLNFAPLPGTGREAAAIKSVFPQAVLFTKGRANEKTIKSMGSPVILHIATHGFFLDSAPGGPGARGLKRKKPAVEPGKEIAEPSPRLSFRIEENPLIRSGLALSGANRLQGGEQQNGILSALEVSQLNLNRTRLVVLSACETGVGEVMNGEGVFGLRRAFQLAGAQNQILSLWKVNDEATTTLMSQFYKNFAAKRGLSASLHEAAKTIAADPKYEHPNYWAAFILSGRTGT